MKGRGDVPLRPSCAVITLRHRRFPSHRKSRIYFSVPNLRIISSHGKSQMSTGCLCHEICEFFFFTRKVTDVHVRFMSRDLRIISSHGKSRISTEGLCHEICESFFFTRKVTDVHVRFMSRDCESFFFTQQVPDVHGSLVKEKSVTSRDIPCEKKKRRPDILFLFTTTKVRK